MKNFVPIDGPKKTIIRNDWLKEFPIFSKETLCSISKRVGPILVSIGWEIRYKEYRPASSVCNLMNVEEGLYASLDGEPGYRRNALSWEQHEKGLYKEAIEEIKKNSPIPLEGPITLSQLLEAYDKEIRDNPFWSSRLDDPILTTAWAGKQKLAYSLAQDYASYWKRNIDSYNEEDKKKIITLADTWHQNILNKIANQDHLNTLIEEAIIKYKLQKLPQEDLIIDF